MRYSERTPASLPGTPPLTLTGRDVGLSERVPMIGFPYHAAQNYFQKMVRCGHRLAVMDAEDNIYTLPPENVDPETGEVIDDTPVTGTINTASMPEDGDDPDMSSFDMDALCILSELFGNELELR